MNNDDLVRLHLPAQFILHRVLLTRAEMAFGFEQGWLDAKDIVELALAKLRQGLSVTPAEEELALLLPQDLDEVSDLVARMKVADEPLEERQRVWLFLALDWLLDHQTEVADPHQIIELLYDDFGHPEEIRGLVRYMPPLSHESSGTLEERWKKYVDVERVRYKNRDVG